MNERRYCSSCVSYQPVEGGMIVETASKSVRRWKCATCIKRVSERKLQSKTKKASEK